MTLETTDSGRAKPQPPLPPKQKKWDAEAALKRIEAISINARTTWFGLLALLTFVLVTLLGVQHIDFFGYGRATQLPLVNVSVPTERFFYAAPVLVAAVYAYFHFYLMKLWDELGQAEPMIDGRPIGDLVFPWLVVDGAMLLRTDGAAPRRALSRVSAFTSLTLTWLFGLGVIAYGLWQSLPAHDPVMSLLNCAALLFAAWVGVTSYLVMRRRLKYRMFGPRTERVWNGWRGVVVGAVCVAAMVMVWERSTNGASRFASDIWLTGAEKRTEAADLSGDLTRKRHLEIAPWLPIAPINLNEAQLTEKPSDWLDKSTAERDFRKHWCSRRELPWAMCVKEPDDHQAKVRRGWCNASSRKANGTRGDPRLTPEACEGHFKQQEAAFQTEWEDRRREYLSVLKKPVLKGRNLRSADLSYSFFPGVDLAGALLQEAKLNEARLEGADLSGSQLENSKLIGTRLEAVNLNLARLNGANLGRAHLDDADLSFAQLNNANLGEAHLNRANLTNSQLEGANLTDARLTKVNAHKAQMREAYLGGAWLNGANLSRARIDKGDLRRARLDGANLKGTWLNGANFNRARLNRTDLSRARMREAYLGGAQIKFSNLSRVKLEGADLSGSDLEGSYLGAGEFISANFSDATFGAAQLSSANFTNAVGLTQNMLNEAIGNDRTLLPKVAGEPLFVWSCWLNAPASLEYTLRFFSEGTREFLRKEWLCGPEGRTKTGRTAER